MAACLLQQGGHQSVVVAGREQRLQPPQQRHQDAQQVVHPGVVRLVGSILRVRQLIAGARRLIQRSPAKEAQPFICAQGCTCRAAMLSCDETAVVSARHGG